MNEHLLAAIESSKRCVDGENASEDLKFCWSWIERMWCLGFCEHQNQPQQSQAARYFRLSYRIPNKTSALQFSWAEEHCEGH